MVVEVILDLIREGSRGQIMRLKGFHKFNDLNAVVLFERLSGEIDKFWLLFQRLFFVLRHQS